MPTALTTAINKTATQYEVAAGNIDFVGQTVTMQVMLLAADGSVIETKTKTRAFADLGITSAMADTIKARLIIKLTTEGDIN